ncbi:MAG: pyrroline-5-carboxylate reductase, partial [Dehalococcoidia bacterium]|nr:pyrroline-5-carboxylate reductase [Dehalococcoidia bacterium]
PARLARLADQLGTPTTTDNAAALVDADLIVVAVKPTDFSAVARQIAGRLAERQVVLSIMAGVTIETLRAGLAGHARVVRAMPNTPAQIGAGVTAWYADDAVGPDDRALVEQTLRGLGEVVEVSAERTLDMVTAVSGSGPAYVFLFIEALIDAAVSVGLSRPVAQTLALHTVAGAVAYLQQAGRHPADLRNEVTSPAGTTAAALAQLERLGFRAAVHDAVHAAFVRAQQLGAASR